MATLRDNYEMLIEGIMGKVDSQVEEVNEDVEKNSQNITSVSDAEKQDRRKISEIENNLKPLNNHMNYAPRQLSTIYANDIKPALRQTRNPGFGFDLTEYAADDWDNNPQYLDTFVTTLDILRAVKIGIPFYYYSDSESKCIELQIDFDRCFNHDDTLFFRFDEENFDGYPKNELIVSDITKTVDGVQKTFANMTLNRNDNYNFVPLRLTRDKKEEYFYHEIEDYYRGMFGIFIDIALLAFGIPLFINYSPITGYRSDTYGWPIHTTANILRLTQSGHTPKNKGGNNWDFNIITQVGGSFSRQYTGNLSDKVLSTFEISPTWNDVSEHGFYVMKQASFDINLETIDQIIAMTYDNTIIKSTDELEEGEYYTWIPYRLLGMETIRQNNVVTENLDLTTVPSTEGTYNYIYKCQVSVDDMGIKTATYGWVPMNGS